MSVKDRRRNRRFILVLLVFFLLPFPATGQENPSKGKSEDENYRLKETEIKGELKDLLGKMRLLESEIVGTVERPQFSYSLPWQEPMVSSDFGEFFGGELEGDLLSETYSFIDRDQFEREVLFPSLEPF